MASVDCGLHATCISGNAKRETQQEQERRAGILILGMCLLVLIALCVAGIVAHRIWRKPPKAPEVNNDIELGVVQQPATPAPTVPRPVVLPARRGSISAAPPPYRVPSFNGAKEDPAVDGMGRTDSSSK